MAHPVFFSAPARSAALYNYITKIAERGDFSEARVRLGAYNLKEVSLGLNRRIIGDGGAGSHYARIDVNHLNSGSWINGTESKATQVAASLLFK